MTAEELAKGLTNSGEKLSEEEVQDLLHEADTNGDGKIDYEEFVKHILSI